MQIVETALPAASAAVFLLAENRLLREAFAPHPVEEG